MWMIAARRSLAMQQLLEEQRVAGGALQHALSLLGRERRAIGQLRRHPPRFLRPQCAQVQLLVGAPALPAV
jgi:hypothetical protein